MKLAIISLGCPKNQVDADRFCRALLEDGHQTVPSAAMADVVIINTCGFIDSAKEEAIENIFNTVALRKDNPNLKIVVTGCLAERYQHDVAGEIPEVNAVVGIGCNGELSSIVTRVLAGEGDDKPLECYEAKTKLKLDGPRVISTPSHFAWLKISEGCANACSYCAIPLIRGPLRSRPMDEVVVEARWLADQGIKELVLVAQDVTAYGDDTGQNQLVPLLKQLESIDGLRWIRLLYTYPERITPELLDTIGASDKILPYIDLPIQHCNDDILTSMRRRGKSTAIRKALTLIREKLPQAVLRTSLIAGYPGETQEQFEELCQFVSETRFDRLGCFVYSPEEGTSAAAMPNQIDEEEKQRRADAIMRLQSNILAEKQQALVGTQQLVICDGYDEDEGVWLCRTAADAPEIDTQIMVTSAKSLVEGDFYTVTITDSDGCDLTAELL